jgi:hypothetical protein
MQRRPRSEFRIKHRVWLAAPLMLGVIRWRVARFDILLE